MQVHLVLRACKCWWLWYLGLGGNISSREPCQLSPEIGNFYLQNGNSIVCGGQGTVIVVDCSIEHLIHIVLEGMSVSQTSFSHISINSLTILMVSKTMESPQKDLLIDASHVSR